MLSFSLPFSVACMHVIVLMFPADELGVCFFYALDSGSFIKRLSVLACFLIHVRVSLCSIRCEAGMCFFATESFPCLWPSGSIQTHSWINRPLWAEPAALCSISPVMTVLFYWVNWAEVVCVRKSLLRVLVKCLYTGMRY